MNVLLYGATGMVGQGVARECELDPGIERIVTVGRRPTGRAHPKTREVVQPNLTDLSSIASELPSINACMFCLGVTSLGKSEEEYSKITYDLTLAIAEQLVRANPAMTFIYVSGASTDSTERGRIMWARVKGRTENALLRCGFKGAYMFRPGAIIPMHGIRSATEWYNTMYSDREAADPGASSPVADVRDDDGAGRASDDLGCAEWLLEAHLGDE
jgi:uncharacterized protein YbjT (DUF2867 family)